MDHLLFSKIEYDIMKFHFLKKNLDVVDDVLYESVKLQHEVPSILGYIKMIKSDKFWRFINLHRLVLWIYNFINFAHQRIHIISPWFIAHWWNTSLLWSMSSSTIQLT
jgi:hypothetical protein